LERLERGGVAPNVIVGTSFGALVGALYALGASPSELRRVATGIRRRDLMARALDVGLHRGALFAGDRLEAWLRSLVGDARIEDAPRTLAIVATDVDDGSVVVLRAGPLARALRASVALPGVFAPVAWQGRRLIDGGLAAPVPLATLAGYPLDLAVGVGVGARNAGSVRAMRALAGSAIGRGVRRALDGPTTFTPPAGRALARALARALESFAVADEASADAPPHSVHVDARPPIHWLRFDRADLAIEAGRRAMEGAWGAVERALGDRPAAAW
jgi:NTE family protein